MGALREPRVTASSYTLLGRDAPSRLLGGEPSFAASRSSARQCFHLGSAGMQMRAANAGGGGAYQRGRVSPAPSPFSVALPAAAGEVSSSPRHLWPKTCPSASGDTQGLGWGGRRTVSTPGDGARLTSLGQSHPKLLPQPALLLLGNDLQHSANPVRRYGAKVCGKRGEGSCAPCESCLAWRSSASWASPALPAQQSDTWRPAIPLQAPRGSTDGCDPPFERWPCTRTALSTRGQNWAVGHSQVVRRSFEV